MRLSKVVASLGIAGALALSSTAAYAAPAGITIMPGETINVDYGVATGVCTAAAPARDRAGNRYLLTAGHCVHGKIGELINQPIYYKKKNIGYIVSAQFWIADYAVIRLNRNVRVGHNDVPHHAYLRPVKTGERVCFHGTKSGVKCGKVLNPNVTAIMRGSLIPGIVFVSSARLGSISGDSGAAVYNKRGVVGILSGGGDGNTSFVPIKNIYDRVGSLLPGFAIRD